jgi:hypothetical protein
MDMSSSSMNVEPKRVLVLSENSSAADKRVAKKAWPPAVGEDFIVFDDNLSLEQYTQGSVEVTMRAILDDKGRHIIECREKDCGNPSFGTLTTSSASHATKHVRVHQQALVRAVKRPKVTPSANPLLLAGFESRSKEKHSSLMEDEHDAGFRARLAREEAGSAMIDHLDNAQGHQNSDGEERGSSSTSTSVHQPRQ